MTNGSGLGNDHVVQLLDQYRTGELSDEQRRIVEIHLEVCGACMAALADLAAFASTVEKGYQTERELAAESEPDWARVRQEIVARTSAEHAQSKRSWLARHVPQTAAAVVAVLAVVIVVQQGVRGPDDVSQALRPTESSERAEVDGPETEPSASEPRASEVDALAALESETETLERSYDESELRDLDNMRRGGRNEDGRGADPNAARQGQEEAFGKAARADDMRENQIAADREAPAVGGVEHAVEPERAVLRDQAAQEKPDAAAVADKLEAQVELDPAAQPLSRFEMRARTAIAEGDTLAANAALEFWNDSLGAGDELEPTNRQRAQALADSLASLVAGRP